MVFVEQVRVVTMHFVWRLTTIEYLLKRVETIVLSFNNLNSQIVLAQLCIGVHKREMNTVSVRLLLKNNYVLHYYIIKLLH